MSRSGLSLSSVLTSSSGLCALPDCKSLLGDVYTSILRKRLVSPTNKLLYRYIYEVNNTVPVLLFGFYEYISNITFFGF